MADRPMRIQRKRAKGWRMPAGAVYVGRPSEWGNPFDVSFWGLDESLKLFDHDCIMRELEDAAAYRAWLAPLKGKDLVCWCPLDRQCHADQLLARANGLSCDSPAAGGEQG